MEAIYIRIFKGILFSALMYIGLLWMGLTSSKVLMIATAPLLASLVNLFTHTMYMVAFITLLLALANYVFDGKITDMARTLLTSATQNISQPANPKN